jgi:GNAT superfamily N-acetyltransferase
MSGSLELLDVEPGDSRLVTDVLPVLRELRGHLTAASLREIYERGHSQGLRFVAAYDGGACVGVAGWRLVSTTSVALKLYVDDLVTTAERRSSGVGRALLAELERRARAHGCHALELDSGVHRPFAHRFYFRERLTITSFHFAKPLDGEGE